MTVDVVGDVKRVVTRTVVDDDDFGRLGAELIEHRAQALVTVGETLRLVVRRDDNGGGDAYDLAHGRAAPSSPKVKMGARLTFVPVCAAAMIVLVPHGPLPAYITTWSTWWSPSRL